MSVARTSEISVISSDSFDAAIREGIERANKTLRNVKSAWVKSQEVKIENGQITGYQVFLKITFVMES